MAAAPWFDRQETTLLWKRVEGFLAGYRQNVALIGGQSVGKTTMLKRLLQQKAAAEPSLMPLYIEVRDDESVAEWAARFIQSLLYGVLRSERAAFLPANLVDVMRLCAARVPQTVGAAEKILAAAERGRDDEVYGRLWDLPQLAAQEARFSCLLVLDEFHKLDRLPVKDPFEKLGRSIMVQGTMMYVVASSQPAAARQILREGLNLLFGQFEILEMGPLDPSACREAIRSVWSDGQKDPLVEHLLLELVQGYPGYLDMLLQGLSRSQLDQTAEKERALLDMLESLLLDPQGALRARCEDRVRLLPSHRNRRAWLQALEAVAGGHHRIAQIARQIGRPQSETLSALGALERTGLVLKQGAFYRIQDRLFELWVRAAYPVLQGMDQIDPAHTRARFRDAAWAWIAKVYEGAHRPMVDQIALLLSQWEGEVVEIEGKRTVLPKFKGAAPLNRRGPSPLILARRSCGGGQAGCDWLVVPWAGSMDEAKARTLVADLSGPEWKEHRKIVMGAYPVDMNARLVLHEGKVRFWDLHVLNNLLDLYGLSRMPFPEGGPLSSEMVPIPPPAHPAVDAGSRIEHAN